MIKVILGPPGTGKTTRLLGLLERYLESGTDLKRIGFISFTRKSISEAVERACKKFDLNKNYFEYFRTIHSLAFRQLCMSTNEVVQRNHLVELGDIIGIPIKGYQSTDQEMYEMQKGDQMVFLESYARLTMQSYEDVFSDKVPDFSMSEFRVYINEYLNYKRKYYLKDFTDMLVDFNNKGPFPDLDVLFVDEAQDLCTLQWSIVAQLIKNSSNVYIAGDDDQAIFRWSGADVDEFLGYSKRFPSEVLSKSYRLPKKVKEFSEKLTEDIENRAEKVFTSKPEQGKVEFAASLENIDMSKGNWLILFRNGYMEKDIVEHIRNQGFVYSSKNSRPLDTDEVKACFNYEKLRAGKEIKMMEANKVISFISKKFRKHDTMYPNKHTLISKLDFIARTGIENLSLPWYRILDKISVEDREYILAARRLGESFIDEPRIRISTIHGAKGGEAENVVVFSDISYRTYKHLESNMDDELRVFYVAVTRAKENLFIVSPQTNCYFNL